MWAALADLIMYTARSAGKIGIRRAFSAGILIGEYTIAVRYGAKLSGWTRLEVLKVLPQRTRYGDDSQALRGNGRD